MSDYKPAVRCVLLKDDRSLVQCILPSDSLLDLRALQSATGRGLAPLTQQGIVSASRGNRLQPLETSRDFCVLPTFVDSSLSANDSLIVDENGLTLSTLRDTLHAREVNIRHIGFTIAAADLQRDFPRQSTTASRSVTPFATLLRCVFVNAWTKPWRFRRCQQPLTASWPCAPTRMQRCQS